ncbi:MAG: hypothetical protein ACJ74E_02475 [Actinomycetes bacterium]
MTATEGSEFSGDSWTSAKVARPTKAPTGEPFSRPETSLLVVRGELTIDDGDTGRLGVGDALRLEAASAFGPVNNGEDIVETIESSPLSVLGHVSR